MTTKEIVQEITERGFLDILKDKKIRLLVVDFYAEWCMPCTMMAPIIESAAEKYSGRGIKFAKINVEDAPQLSEKYEISSIPCIIFFKDGKEIDRIKGSINEDELEEKLKSYVRLTKSL